MTVQSAGHIGTRVARGAAWMVSLRFADRILGFGSTLILARLLIPEDFGLVALATALTGALAAFSEFGFDLALIQNQQAGRDHYNTAWTFGILRSVVISAILLIIAAPAASWFDDPRLTELILVFAIFSLIGGFGNIGIVEFRKNLQLHKHFVFTFSSRLAGVLTAVTLAFTWQNYWALVAGLAATRLVRLVLSYVMHPYRPRFSLAGWRDIFHFSKWILLNGIIRIAGRRSSLLVIGAILNPAAIGLYTMANNVATTVSDAFAAPIKNVMFPGYAKLSGDSDSLRSMFLASYALIVAVASPAAVGIGLTAELAVPLILGDNWLEAIPVIELLACAAFLSSLRQIRPLLLAINKPNYVTYLTSFSTVLLLPSLALGVWTLGIAGAALAIVFANFAELMMQYVILHRLINVSIVDIGRKVWRSLVACAILAICVYLAKKLMVQPVDASVLLQFLHLGAIIGIGAVTYMLTIFPLWIISGRPAGAAEALMLSSLRRVFSTKADAH